MKVGFWALFLATLELLRRVFMKTVIGLSPDWLGLGGALPSAWLPQGLLMAAGPLASGWLGAG